MNLVYDESQRGKPLMAHLTSFLNLYHNNLADHIGYGIGNEPKELSSLKAVSLLKIELELLESVGEEVKTIMQSVANTF